jgi:hypothetical protein
MKFKPICFFTSEFLTRGQQWRRGWGETRRKIETHRKIVNVVGGGGDLKCCDPKKIFLRELCVSSHWRLGPTWVFAGLA